MHTVSYSRHRFPAEVIQHAVWLYIRFPLSFRDVEDLLAQRGIDVSYETVRRWSVKFGLAYAKSLRKNIHVPMCAGISMKSSSGLTASAFIFGAPLIAKAKSWTCWYNLDGTSRPR
jgi:hypothetical protein